MYVEERNRSIIIDRYRVVSNAEFRDEHGITTAQARLECLRYTDRRGDNVVGIIEDFGVQTELHVIHEKTIVKETPLLDEDCHHYEVQAQTVFQRYVEQSNKNMGQDCVS